MNKLYSIEGMQVALFTNKNDVNKFLKIYDGNIVDIQYRRTDHIDIWMIVYVKQE